MISPVRLVSDPDAEHEARIMACYERWREGEAEWPELVALIAERSPEQVERMEVAKGLR
jgi:hypothetical protein